MDKPAENKDGTLRKEIRQWEVIFNSIKDLVSIQSPDCKYIRVNKSFAEAFNLKPEEIIGKTCYELVHGMDAPWPNCPHHRTINTKNPETEEFFEPRLGIYLQVSTSPILNEKEELVATVHIAKNITERKKLEEVQIKITKELKTNIETTKRFNKLAVGRELKMIELKEQIKELERKLKEKTKK